MLFWGIVLLYILSFYQSGAGGFCYCVIGKMRVFLLSVIVKTCLALAVIGQFTVAVMAKLSSLLSVIGKISLMFCCY